MSLSPSTEPIKLPPMLGLPADFTVPDVIPLTTPSVPVPSIINTERALERAAESLRAASGPVAVDTERAQGIRYGIRAFLVQLKREDKLYLIDPEAFSDLRIINDALADAEWIIHAATQDFPSLDLLGMRPRRLFDTELGARLAGLERVNLSKSFWGTNLRKNTPKKTGHNVLYRSLGSTTHALMLMYWQTYAMPWKRF